MWKKALTFRRSPRLSSVGRMTTTTSSNGEEIPPSPESLPVPVIPVPLPHSPPPPPQDTPEELVEEERHLCFTSKKEFLSESERRLLTDPEPYSDYDEDLDEFELLSDSDSSESGGDEMPPGWIPSDEEEPDYWGGVIHEPESKTESESESESDSEAKKSG